MNRNLENLYYLVLVNSFNNKPLVPLVPWFVGWMVVLDVVGSRYAPDIIFIQISLEIQTLECYIKNSKHLVFLKGRKKQIF